MKYDPFEETYDINIKKFVAGLVQNDIETIKLFTFDTNYLPTNMIIANESLLESFESSNKLSNFVFIIFLFICLLLILLSDISDAVSSMLEQLSFVAFFMLAVLQ